MTKFLAIFSLVIIVLLAFAACGEESTPTPAPAAQAIEAEVQRSVAAALADQSADFIREDAMSTEDMSALVQEAIGAQAPYAIPMPDHSPIPGRDAEEMARHSPVLSTVKYGGVSTDRACLRRVAAPIMSTWAVPTPWQGGRGAITGVASEQALDGNR